MVGVQTCPPLPPSSRSIKTPKKKKRKPIYSHLDRTSLPVINKGIFIWPKRELFLTGPTREIASGQNGPILAARVASQNAGFASSFPLADSAMHIVNDLFAIVMGVARINFHQRQVISIYCTNSTFSPLSCGRGYGGWVGGGGVRRIWGGSSGSRIRKANANRSGTNFDIYPVYLPWLQEKTPRLYPCF